MNIKQYLKKNGWLVALTILFDSLAFMWWSNFLSTGQIYDGRHGITFVGDYAMEEIRDRPLGNWGTDHD